ncbi:hypothetical protein BGZ50_008234 [Haplosporangium sp. Z 11]|nr:hypothetical protein BGZ50_008234 [Haplosporangium sp. Z 11]
MVRPSYFAVATLFALVGHCAADTVLGGIVDYLPACFDYGQGDFMFFIEYNNIMTDSYRVPFIITEHRTLEGLYGVAKDDLIVSKYVPPLLSKDYKVNTGLQPFNVRDKTRTRYMGISLARGIRMIRFKYIPNVFEPGWMKGVQVRFTENMVSKISVAEHGVNNTIAYDSDFGIKSIRQTLGIDLECFMAIGSILPENRLSDYQLGSCFFLINIDPLTAYDGKDDNGFANQGEGIDSNYFGEEWMVKNSYELLGCEQKARVIVPPPPPEDPLIAAIKYISVAAVGFIPTFGPMLAFGLGAAFELADSSDKYAAYMVGKSRDYTVSKAQEEYPKLMKALAKARKR